MERRCGWGGEQEVWIEGRDGEKKTGGKRKPDEEDKK